MLIHRQIFHQQVFQAAAFVVILGGSTVQAVAQPMRINPAPNGGPVTPAPSASPSVEEKRAENAEQLRVAMRKLDANGVTDAATAQEVAFYQTRDAVLAQQDIVEQQVKDLEARKAEFEAQLKSPPPENKQYKFSELDRLKDDLAAEQARASLVGDRLATANANLKKAKAAVEECEAKRRQAQAAYDSGKDAPNVAELAIAADRARQDAALANETLALRKREVERDELAGQLLKLDIKSQQDLIARISPQVAFTEADLQEQLDSIKKSEESATRALARVQAELHTTETEIKNTQQKLDAATGDKSVLAEALTAQRRTRERLTENVDSLAQRLQQLAQLRTAWQRRYEVATAHRDQKDDELWAKFMTAQKETKGVLDQLASNLRTQIINMRSVRNSLSSAAKKLEAAAARSPELAVQIGIQQKQLEETLKIYEKNLVTIETSRRVHEKLLDEVGQTVEAINPKALALGVWYQAKAFWNKELLPLSDKSITYGQSITSLTILVVGWIMSRFTSGVFANRFLRRFRLSKDATSVIRSLVFYSLLILVSLAALNTINVPLTAFTILGGALAIGVGFGSQTLINNFIGGLIMLAERPVRLGERITFKDIDGVVEDVGFRCTKVRTQADHLVTIPNSTLVNESIENVDRRRTIRRTFTLAVTYNVSREQMEAAVQAIRDILEEKDIRERIHPIVGFEELSPRVHFSDFATESLNIHVTYWYAPIDSSAFADHTERVNFHIMEEFDRLGVEFAFPSKTAYVTKQTRPGRPRGDSYAA
jgi:small-conductance mechanosensitive channel